MKVVQMKHVQALGVGKLEVHMSVRLACLRLDDESCTVGHSQAGNVLRSISVFVPPPRVPAS